MIRSMYAIEEFQRGRLTERAVISRWLRSLSTWQDPARLADEIDAGNQYEDDAAPSGGNDAQR